MRIAYIQLEILGQKIAAGNAFMRRRPPKKEKSIDGRAKIFADIVVARLPSAT